MSDASSRPTPRQPEAAQAQPAAGATRILDRGYRRYEGERRGIEGSMRSVWRYTVHRVLGIHRLSRFKVLPIIMIAIAYVPALVYVGITVVTNQLATAGGPGGDPSLGPGPGQFANSLLVYYAGYYGTTIAAVVLFSAFVAPEVLCPDRRTGMLGLYLASPLNRWSYLASKGAAVLSVMAAVTLGPALVLLIGYTTQGYGPPGFGAWLRTFGRIIAAGLGVGTFHTMISLAISSITSRKAAASAAFVALVVGTGALGGVLRNNGVSIVVGAFDLLSLPLELVYRIFGEPHPLCDPSNFFVECEELSTPIVYLASAGWLLLAFFVIINRYRRLAVTR